MKKPLSIFSAVALSFSWAAPAVFAEEYPAQSHIEHAETQSFSESIHLDAPADPGADILPFTIESESSVKLSDQELDASLLSLEDLLRRIQEILDRDMNGGDDDEEDDDSEDDDEEDEDDDEEDEDEDSDEDDDEEDDEENDDPIDRPEEDVQEFDAELTGAQEVPQTTSTGSGIGHFQLIGNDLQYHVTVNGLSSPITGAHFHHGEEDETGPVVEPITMSGSTSAVASATWTDLTEEELEWLNDEEIYVNVHTTRFPAGEVRGQVED